MRIALGCDHAALDLKRAVLEFLQEAGHAVTDHGTYTEESCDYPEVAANVTGAVCSQGADRGILLCGTGIGMSIAANKTKGIRAALCHDTYSASMSRRHNDSNVLCMGARVVGSGLALAITDCWLAEAFEGGRHQRRLDMVESDGQ